MSSPKQPVGRSSRTPYKHWLLNHLLGQVVGVMSRGSRWPVLPLHIADLCAGDGDPGTDTSPMIIAKHVRWLRARRMNWSAGCHFIEKNENTCAVLAENITEGTAFNIDAADYVFYPRKDQAVFIHVDPNHIADMPPASQLTALMGGKATTGLMTLGCNVGGLKRVDREDREKWVDYIRAITTPMPAWHDAVLVQLIRDDSQWAYLMRLPLKWSDDTQARVQRVGDKMWPKGVRVVSLRDDPTTFEAILTELFLTKKERANEPS